MTQGKSKIRRAIVTLAIMLISAIVFKGSSDDISAKASDFFGECETDRVKQMGDNRYWWKSEGTAASHGVKWRTMGYAITIDKLPEGACSIPDDSLIAWVDADETTSASQLIRHEGSETRGGVQTTYWSVDADYLDEMVQEAVDSSGAEEVSNNSSVYLQPIIMTYYFPENHIGENVLDSNQYRNNWITIRKTKIMSLAAWKKEERWSNTSYFYENYNVEVQYTGQPVDVKVDFTSNGTTIAPSIERKEYCRGGDQVNVQAIINDAISQGLNDAPQAFTASSVLSNSGCYIESGGKTYALEKLYFHRVSKPNKQKRVLEGSGVEKAYLGSGAVTIITDDRGKKANPSSKFTVGASKDYQAFATNAIQTKYTAPTKDFVIKLEFVEVPMDTNANIKTYRQEYDNSSGKKVWREVPSPNTIGGPYSYGDIIEIKSPKKLSGSKVASLVRTCATAYGTSYDVDKIADMSGGKNLKTENSDGDFIMYDSDLWDALVATIRNRKFEMPESGITYHQFYASEVPVYYLGYVQKADGSVELVYEEEYKSGKRYPYKRQLSSDYKAAKKTVTLDGEEYKMASTYAVTGNKIGVFEATSNCYSSTSLPTAMAGTSVSWEVDADEEVPSNVFNRTYTVGENCLFMVAVYANDSVSPPADSSEPEELPEPDPVPDVYTHSDQEWTWSIPSGHTSGSASKVGLTMTPNATFTGYVEADNERSNGFITTTAIPTSEYAEVGAAPLAFVTEGSYQRHTVTGIHVITIRKTYEVVTTDEEGNESTTTEVVERPYNVVRYAEFYTFNYGHVYTPQEVSIQNYCLPDDNIETIPLKNNPNASASFSFSKVTSSPSYDYKEYWNNAPVAQRFIDLGTMQVQGGVPYENWTYLAEQQVGQITARNDYAVINTGTGTQLLLSNSYHTATMSGRTIPSPPVLDNTPNNHDDADSFNRDNLLIDAEKTNGEYQSKGGISYEMTSSTNGGTGATKTWGMVVNNVILHTPVVCVASVIDQKDQSQAINPTGAPQVILDNVFTVHMDTSGTHNSYPGYGTRDYGKYILRRQIRFAFDVYSCDGTKFFPANTWITIGDTQGEDIKFYLPTWVPEGTWAVRFRVYALNADANSGLDHQEFNANKNIKNYVAKQEFNVEVVGKVFGLNVFDISDYPAWEPVFRVNGQYTRSDRVYKVGNKDEHGRQDYFGSIYTLPMMDGKHPTILNYGSIKPGYVVRFSLNTIGEMYNANDYIKITPKYYYVNGSGEREEVDIYYTQTFGGERHYCVKVGSDLDNLNMHSLYLGKAQLAVDKEEIEHTAAAKLSTVNAIMHDSQKVWTYSQIKIPSALSTFTAYKHESLLEKRNGTIYTPFEAVVAKPTGVSQTMYDRSVQTWYGEFYFPSEIHAVGKNATDQAAFERELRAGIDYTESFWKRDGYIVVNFDITTINANKETLSYYHAANNMWKTEGFNYTQKDYSGNIYNLQDGDFVFYKLTGTGGKYDTASDDWQVGGTH